MMRAVTLATHSQGGGPPALHLQHWVTAHALRLKEERTTISSQPSRARLTEQYIQQVRVAKQSAGIPPLALSDIHHDSLKPSPSVPPSPSDPLSVPERSNSLGPDAFATLGVPTGSSDHPLGFASPSLSCWLW
eukprot:COSAG06_NODE_7095_length_2637_cov_2.256107_3_plen_133_part_00